MPRVDAQPRELNHALWAILLKPGPMTNAEKAYIEECERKG